MTFARHILITTDFSDAAVQAVKAGADIAKATGAKVTLLHTFDPAPMVPPIVIPDPGRMEATVEQEMREAVTKELETIRKTYFADHGDCQIVAETHTNAAHGISDYAKKNDVDLVVVGTHGRTGLAHMLIGSVAEKVVRHAPCAVLAVRTKG